MKKKVALRILFPLALTALLVFTCINDISAQDQKTSSSPTISDLNWLAGDWQTAEGRRQTDEHWTQPAGGLMMGLGRTVTQGRTLEFEYLRIEQRPDGIFYVAHPQARCPATDFKMTRLSAMEVVFENPAHDFPKRIMYRKADDGTLSATVDAGPGSKGITFSYRPMKK